MDAFELIKTRRSTRKFKDQPIEEELLNMVIEAGRYAPSGGNSQTTHFIVIKNKDVLEKIRAEVEKQFAAMEITPGMYRSKMNSINLSKRGNYRFHYDAPVLIVTANKKDYGNNLADCSCALENMMIMANGLNLGSCWINQLKWLNENPEILKIMYEIGLKKDERVYGALSVGYPDSEDGMPNRQPLPRNGNEVTIIE